MVTYGPWFDDNVFLDGKRPFGIILDQRGTESSILVMWSHTDRLVWELNDDMVVVNESR